MTQAPHREQADLTLRYNVGAGRHGWLRSTPAYSLKVVERILDQSPDARRVYDPFSGTGTRAVSAASRGLSAVATELNPFLVWLGTVKWARYSEEEVADALALASAVIQ